MPFVKSLEDLKRVRDEALRKRDAKAASGQTEIVVGMGTPGIAAGARETIKAVLAFIEQHGVSGIVVRQTGSLGQDSWEPIVQVVTPAGPDGGQARKVTYGRVTPEVAERIMQEHVVNGQVVAEFVIPGS